MLSPSLLGWFRDRFFTLLSQASKALREKGIRHVICAVVEYCYYRLFKASRTFTFQGEVYRYFYHPYNITWRNERAVEVPIVWKIVNKYVGRNVLEVGNVLSHYFPVHHDVLDKYEKAKGVINEDVVEFSPAKNTI
jgi:hypothetical protein